MKWPEMEPHGKSAIDATPSITSSIFPFPLFASAPASLPPSSATVYTKKFN
jgi:hypothetical protein